MDFARENRIAYENSPYSRYSRDNKGAHLFNAYRFEYKGYQVFYIDTRKNDDTSDWVINLKVHTPWGKVRVYADFGVEIQNAEWVNTHPDVLMLYKLSRD